MDCNILRAFVICIGVFLLFQFINNVIIIIIVIVVLFFSVRTSKSNALFHNYSQISVQARIGKLGKRYVYLKSTFEYAPA